MDMLKIEQQRQALEGNLQQLRQSLKYWQAFEAEYEGLKEEILDAQPNVDAAKLDALSMAYDGELVTKQVIRELAGLDKGSPRTGQQIVRDLERRVEYVQRNCEVIQRRFFDAEAKLEEFDFAAMRDAENFLGAGRGGGENFPLTEIHEELDEDGNVISSRLERPEEKQARLVESLRKAGLTTEDLEEGDEQEQQPTTPLKPAITNASPPPSSIASPAPAGPSRVQGERGSVSSSDLPSTTGDSTQENETPRRPQVRKKSVSFTADTKESPELVRVDSEESRKSVSFNDKVAVAPAAPPPDPRTVQFSPQVEEIPPQPLGPPGPAQTGAQLPSQPEKDVSQKAPSAPSAQNTHGKTKEAELEVQKELRASFKPGDRVATLDDDEEVVSKNVVIPEDENEEDAQTRREMLDYHLNEVGHVVAQMDLNDDDDYNDDDFAEDDDYDDDETSSHFTGSSFQGDEDTPYTSGLSDDDEDEDEYGRTKGKVITDDYRQQMMEMQKRLIGNLGPAPEGEDVAEVDPDLDPNDVRKLVIRDKRSSMSSDNSDGGDKKAGGKKRVSFAQELDVAEKSEPSSAKADTNQEGGAVAPAVADTVAEKPATTAPQAAPGATPSPAKTSRFKKARNAPPQHDPTSPPTAAPTNPTSITDFDSPTGPAGRTLAETLIERPAPDKSTKGKAAPSADDPDPIAERRQLAADYYRRRNEMIRQQGGFKGNREEDEALGELMEERPDGRVRKVSRFKAARIKP
ncbi:hypothetical protein KC331_g5603 [Hortaea werneckii]|uniref:DUF3835 domain-containing protein n=1 Tax=Hortaea werneckii TaxID=91943 RepID=A0A3M7CA16_HORWE|nr:hypothetical protein KC331_g5603 [Hortaea werneckii]RMY49002.1 hypothetical protein D0865_07756 [Hortaea werneckii]